VSNGSENKDYGLVERYHHFGGPCCLISRAEEMQENIGRDICKGKGTTDPSKKIVYGTSAPGLQIDIYVTVP
jgi:hypothetical protein